MNQSAIPDGLLASLTPKVLGVLARRAGDFGQAEDAVQEGLLAAAEQWPRDGLPADPFAWLFRVASRRLIDAQRREIARRQRETAWFHQTEAEIDAGLLNQSEAATDDSLTLFFMACHPGLAPPLAIALTLRALGGLTTAQIAQAFLVPEATMAQRISRAKAKIKQAGGRFELPDAAEIEGRLATVRQILYLIFNEGYTATSGAHLQHIDLAGEAIRLGRLLLALRPDDPETAGLLGLMLLNHARRLARVGPQGEIVPLSDQNRQLWDRAAIGEGQSFLEGALRRGAIGPYQIQAAIAALHDEAATADQTDWPQIMALYELLLRLSDNPLVALNHAVAVAMVRGPRAGLALLTPLETRLVGYHRLAAVRGHLWELMGDFSAAESDYRLAAGQTGNQPERDYLLRKASTLFGQ